MTDPKTGLAVVKNPTHEPMDKFNEDCFTNKKLHVKETHKEKDDEHCDNASSATEISVSSGTSSIPLSRPCPPKNSSGRNNAKGYTSLRQWVVSSFSSTTEEAGEWCCKKCSYQNVDPTSRNCAVCGWSQQNGSSARIVNSSEHKQIPTYSGGSLYLVSHRQNNVNENKVGPKPTKLSTAISASTLYSRNNSDGSDKENAIPPTDTSAEPRNLSEPCSSIEGQSPSISTVDSAASTILASNLAAIPMFLQPDFTSNNLLDALYGQEEDFLEITKEDDMISPPNILAEKPSDRPSQAISVLTEEESLSQHMWNEHEAPIIVSRCRGVGSKKSCRSCSNRIFLVWLVMLLILAGCVTTLVILLRDRDPSISEPSDMGSPFEPPETRPLSTSLPPAISSNSPTQSPTE